MLFLTGRPTTKHFDVCLGTTLPTADCLISTGLFSYFNLYLYAHVYSERPEGCEGTHSRVWCCFVQIIMMIVIMIIMMIVIMIVIIISVRRLTNSGLEKARGSGAVFD